MVQLDLAQVHKMCMIHILFKNKYMLESEFREKCFEIVGADDDSTVNTLLAQIGEAVAVLRMRVKSFTYLNDREKYIALVNLGEDHAAKLSSKYSYAQLQFFYSMVEAIATNAPDVPGVCVMRKTDAFNLDIMANSQASQVSENVPGRLVQLRMADKERTIEQLIKDGWLAEDPNSQRIAIGPRSFVELKSYLLGLDLKQDTRVAWQKCL